MKLNDARVLLVDDEAALCEIFARWLRQAGCLEVRTAGNGLEALQEMERQPVDVLITDVRMPAMDGVALVRRLAELERRIACILFVSGIGDVDAREMYDLGVEAFLAKPLRMEELATALENALADRSTLWKNPVETAALQEVAFDVSGDGFRLGRGGFSARSPKPLTEGTIGFACDFGGRQPALAGQGTVRWRSPTDQAVGIEFSFLDSPGREWVLSRLEAERPRSFIPRL